MDITVQALKKTGTTFLILDVLFFFITLVFIHFLIGVPLTKMTSIVWGLVFAIAAFTILFFFQALSYLRAEKLPFLKAVKEKPQLITDIYTALMPSSYNMYGMRFHDKTIVDYFNITIILADKGQERILVHQRFFKPVLEYVKTIAPQAKIHN